jgi:hypothetical protein
MASSTNKVNRMSNFIALIESKLDTPEGLGFVELEIQLLFSEIAQTKSISDAELIFKNLEDIQFVLAKAVFKEGLNVSPFLREFIYDFDRIDDVDVKNLQYQKIKSNPPNVTQTQ